MTRRVSFDQALGDLADQGLNWLAFLADSRQAEPPLRVGAEAQVGLLFFLARGTTFAEQTNYQAEGHPFDERSARLAEAFVSTHCAGQGHLPELVFPPLSPVDMRTWLEVGQVQFRSQLGIGIRPECGPWFAVRAIARVRLSPEEHAALLERYPPLGDQPSPCALCEDKPCVAACPAGAVPTPAGSGRAR